MSVERARDRGRASGLVARYPRPDGISRRVATAARDRHPGPPPEPVPTGWHRHVFDHPAVVLNPGPRQENGPVDATGRHRRQMGRVLDGSPTRRRPAIVAGSLGAVVALGVGAALILAAPSGRPADSPPVPATQPATPAATRTVIPTPTVDTAGPTDPEAPPAPAPAVVSTLSAGDPGFGWPSTAFGGVPAGG